MLLFFFLSLIDLTPQISLTHFTHNPPTRHGLKIVSWCRIHLNWHCTQAWPNTSWHKVNLRIWGTLYVKLHGLSGACVTGCGSCTECLETHLAAVRGGGARGHLNNNKWVCARAYGRGNERAALPAPLHSLLPVLLEGRTLLAALGRTGVKPGPWGAPAARDTRGTGQVGCKLPPSCHFSCSRGFRHS